MRERLSATSRNDISRAYKDNIFFKVVKTLEQPLVAEQAYLRLTPEEVFQEVVGWLDRVSRTEDEEELAYGVDNAWAELYQQLRQLSVPGCPDREIEQSVGVILSLLLTCFIKLSDETLEGYCLYTRLRNILTRRLLESMRGAQLMLGSIICHPYYQRHNQELDEWLIDYTLHSKQTLTSRDGTLKTTLTKDGQHPKGRKKSQLFVDPDGEKDEETTQYWSNLFIQYVAWRNRSSATLDTKKDNFLLVSINAFRKYWQDKCGLNLTSAGAAYYGFLVDDCHFALGTDKNGKLLKPQSVCDTITRLLREPLDNWEGNYLKVCSFFTKD